MSDTLADFNTHRIEGFARMGNTPFSVPLFSQIDGNLWSGGCPRQRAPEHFKFIVSLYPWEPYEIPEETTYTVARLYDSHDVPDARLLTALADYVNAVAKIGPTLVHCQAGLNRSGLVTGMALVRRGMQPVDAIRLLREKRCNAVLCNQAFEKFLLWQAA